MRPRTCWRSLVSKSHRPSLPNQLSNQRRRWLFRALCPCPLIARWLPLILGACGTSRASQASGQGFILVVTIMGSEGELHVRGYRKGSGLSRWLLQHLCGLGCFAGGQAAYSSPFVGWCVIGLEVNECVILSFALLGGLHRRFISLGLSLVVERLWFFWNSEAVRF